MSSLRVAIVLALSTALLVSCSGSKPQSASAVTPVPGAVTQSMTRLATAPRFYVDQVGTASNPSPDRVIDVSSAGPLVVNGWAVDPVEGVAAGVEIAIDQNPYPAVYGGERPDVAAALKNPAYDKSGFQFTIPASRFSKGLHTVSVRIINKDKSGYFQSSTYHVQVE